VNSSIMATCKLHFDTINEMRISLVSMGSSMFLLILCLRLFFHYSFQFYFTFFLIPNIARISCYHDHFL
jgi:hypothetical protein